MNLGASEILLILLVVLIVFGGKRLPELARNIGRGLSEFRRATQDVQRELNSTLTDIQTTPARPAKSDPIANSNRDAQPAAQPRATESQSGSPS